MLLPALGKPTYTAPEAYFETFPLKVIAIKDEAETPAFTAPEGYFEDLPGKILQRIRHREESEWLPDVLQKAEKSTPYAPPSGYFETLPQRILTKAKPATIIPMAPRRTVWRYAAAAVITGLLGLGLFHNLNERNSDSVLQSNLQAAAREILQNNNFEQALAAINENDIVQYLEVRGQDVEAALVAATAAETELPEPEELLFDEDVLNELLKDADVELLN